MSRISVPFFHAALGAAAVFVVLAGDASAENLPIVDQAIAHHGGDRFRASETELDLCSKSGCFHVRARLDGDAFVYDVAGMAGDEPRYVHWSNDALDVRRAGLTYPVPPGEEARWRDWVMQRVYFAFLPYRLGDPSVRQEDLGTETWDGRPLRKVEVTFAPGSSTDADDEFLFWFDPETARLEQFAYSFHEDEGGLRFRRLVDHRRIGGLLFADQLNLGVDGPGHTVDQVTPSFVEGSMRFLSKVRFSNVEVRDLDAGPWSFLASRTERQEAERAVLGAPSPARARRSLAHLTEEPHVAGTPQEKAVAEWVRDQLRDAGLETEIVRYDVFLDQPRHVALKLVEPEVQELSLREDFLAEDKDSSGRGAFPAFHGYSASGSVEGEVVYANYGTPDDYAKLDEMDVSVAGRIVIARYGKVFRGLKVYEAQQRGALGVIIYSDPADDGYAKGDVYPDGPMRPPSAIQRGSVQFLSWQPGDPSTPGWPSRDGARRVERAAMTNLPEIPSLPLSYGEAEKILRLLGGPRVPDAWQGGLPFAYHIGPGGAALAMEVEMEGKLRPIFDVFGRIPGREEPDRLVLLGNHRDAWTHGAVDPNSGTAVFLETARALGEATKTGWRPRRTIVLASWDAEEYGLVGSTEWGEDQAETLGRDALAYVNLDSAVTGGKFGASGTPSLRDLVVDTIRAVPEPLRDGTVGEAWATSQRSAWADQAPVELLAAADPPFALDLEPLGSGSDYTVFLDHLGIPSVDFGFSGSYGVYHSIYDDFRWMERFGDPQFVYHAAAARFYGLLAVRLAGAEVVPLRFARYARPLREELDELRRKTVRQARQEDASGWSPDFAPVLAALEAFESAGVELDRAVVELVHRGDAEAASTVNDVLIQLERAFLADDGLPGRPWFRHLLYAPGTTTGYASWPFPELAEAVEKKDAALFEKGTQRVVGVLAGATRRLHEATRLAVP